jgi:hypothetical protein
MSDFIFYEVNGEQRFQVLWQKHRAGRSVGDGYLSCDVALHYDDKEFARISKGDNFQTYWDTVDSFFLAIIRKQKLDDV